MKLRATLLYIGLMASSALAQSQDAGIYSATKKDTMSGFSTSASSGGGLMPLVQMALAATVVIFLLKSLMPKLAGKFNKSMATKVGSSIKVEESATFAGGTLYVVQAKSKTLLVSVNGTGVVCLADITETQSRPAVPTFMDILEEKTAAPEKAMPQAIAYLSDEAPVQTDEAETELPQDFAVALERLNRIAK